MDLNETKIREEIEFWQDFIDKWKAFRKEPVHKMAVESLIQAEKKLQSYLLTRDIQRAGTDDKNTGDQCLLTFRGLIVVRIQELRKLRRASGLPSKRPGPGSRRLSAPRRRWYNFLSRNGKHEISPYSRRAAANSEYARSALHTSMDEQTLREDVDFWRRFIDDWKRVNKTPPLSRMLEALTCAEHKLKTYRLREAPSEG